MEDICLEIRNIKKKYANFTLGTISYGFQQGKWYYIRGNNGSGKTTLLNIISNYIYQDEGDVLFWGKPMKGNEEYIKNRFSFIPNSVPLPQHVTPGFLSNLYCSMYNKFDKLLFQKLLAAWGIHEKKYKIGEMSDGMKKKVLFALEISYYPEIMLVDEIYNDLDQDSIPFLFNLLDDLVSRNKTMIIVTSHIDIDIMKRNPIIIDICDGKFI